ncbi:MAG TPA: carbon-nitrogen hydrolase family protein [Opitutaceae bacterium]
MASPLPVIHVYAVMGIKFALHSPPFRRGAAALFGAAIWFAAFAADPGASANPLVPPVEKMAPRRDGLPRKVLLATIVSGYDVILKLPLEERFARLDEYVDAMDAQARVKYPGKRLDLVVLTEYFLSRPGEALEKTSVRLGEVTQRVGACAKRHGCYIVAPMILREEGEPARYANAAALFDRQGRVAGIYRKVHPATDLNYDNLEGGITPGKDFPIFDCDFGRIGIQICMDVFYAEGWQALAKEGAEIVAFPSETPQTSRPSMYALLNRYYVVSATPRDHAAVYNPLGMIDAQITQEGVLVHQVDLSYALSGWQQGLDGGEALKRKFGNRVGYAYYQGEDAGIFWSNDPKTSIGEMFRVFGFPEPQDDADRSKLLIDKMRGGPPELP